MNTQPNTNTNGSNSPNQDSTVPSFHPSLPPPVPSSPLEPWPDPVDGQALLNELEQLLRRFVVLPKWAPEALALWTLHTYAFELRDVTTYLGIESPEKRCGKTTLLAVLSELVNRPIVSANVSSPAFFRVIQETQPTLLIDEADTFLQGNDELRGILNAGYTRKTAYVLRVVSQSPNHQLPTINSQPSTINCPPSSLATFSCWCPKAVATIGRLPDTLADRCIVTRMQRKTAKETCERLRNLDTAALKRQCRRFVLDHASLIAAARPELPPTLNDRAADIWEPLLALADLAGGDWPAKARQAAAALTATSQESSPIGALLMDIFVVFNLEKADRLFTRDLLDGLNDFDGRPWAEITKGKEITEIWLAQQLRPYGIRSRNVRIGKTQAKGYVQEDFRDVFRRYIPRCEVEELRNRCTDPEPDPAP